MLELLKGIIVRFWHTTSDGEREEHETMQFLKENIHKGTNGGVETTPPTSFLFSHLQGVGDLNSLIRLGKRKDGRENNEEMKTQSG